MHACLGLPLGVPQTNLGRVSTVATNHATDSAATSAANSAANSAADSAANIVPLSESAWAVVLVVTGVLCVAWVLGVVLVSRQRARPVGVVRAKDLREPGTANRISARLVLSVVTAVAVLAVILFLVGRAADLVG